MEKLKQGLTVLKDLEDFIVPLSKEEFTQLEGNIVEHGCRDPLIVWHRKDSKLILVDGHNRYKICKKHKLPFKTKKIHFADLAEAKIWMVDNQLGRRNLNPDQLSYYRGVRYLSLKKKRGGFENVKSKGQNETSTAVSLSSKFIVSESTIKRDAKFAEGLNVLGNVNPALKVKILSGEVKVKKADIQILTQCKNLNKLTIKNEADLSNKAKLIRDSILDELEQSIAEIENKKLASARRILKDAEPPFTNKGDRLKKIKGRIISAVNRAINNRDVSAMKELKDLIDRLEDEIFE